MGRREDHWDLQLIDRHSGRSLYRAQSTNGDRGRELICHYLNTELTRRFGNQVALVDSDLTWVLARGSGIEPQAETSVHAF